jgi:hypothetical protein
MAELDVNIDNQGTIFLFTPITRLAREWVEEHLQLEGWQCLGPSFAVDHRLAQPLAEDMVADGLRVG